MHIFFTTVKSDCHKLQKFQKFQETSTLKSASNQPSTHTTEKSSTHLLTTKVEHVTVLIKQTALYKKNA